MSAITPLPPSGPATPPAPAPTAALDRLAAALADLPTGDADLGRWRWAVRQHLVGVCDLLTAGASGDADGWLVARGATALRRRDALLARISRLGPQVLESTDVPAVAVHLRRLVVDVRHHLQRVSDLAWDEVELELGGED